jgi:hypothetical protein
MRLILLTGSELVTIAADLSIIDQPNASQGQQDFSPETSRSPRPSRAYNEYTDVTTDDHHASSPWTSAPANTIDGSYALKQREPYNPVQHQQAPEFGHSLIPSQVQGEHSNTSSGHGSNFTPNSSEDLIDLDDSPRPQHPKKFEKQPDVDDRQSTRIPARKPLPLPPSIAALPPLSEAERKRQAEQQAETYSIRHITWTDHTEQLRESPVLIQNKNGPCPLLALVNGLIMRSDRDMPPPIVKALMIRETISLGLLIQALFDELTTYTGIDEELPDIEALSRFLTMLHTGMNVNPRLILVRDLVFFFPEISY